MRHVRYASFAITLAGGLLLLAALLFRLAPVWALVGLLLLWAGLVKIVVVALWRRLGDGDRAPATDA